MVKKLTKDGIAHDLTISPYKLIQGYEEDEVLTFVFSSQLYVEIFKRKQTEYREYVSKTLSNRFKLDIEMNKLADISLYMKTEKRGFLIIGKEEYKCIDTIRLSGEKLTNKS